MVTRAGTVLPPPSEVAKTRGLLPGDTNPPHRGHAWDQAIEVLPRSCTPDRDRCWCSRCPATPKPRKPVTPKPRFRLPGWPLALVLNIVVLNGQAVIAEGEEDLVPDGDSTLRISPTELLHDVFGYLRGEGRLGRAAPLRFMRRDVWPWGHGLRVYDPNPPLFHALDIDGMSFQAGRCIKSRVVGSSRWWPTTGLPRRRRKVRCFELGTYRSC